MAPSTLFSAGISSVTGASSSSHSSNSSQGSLLVDDHPIEIKQTRQKIDYRPKSTLHFKTRAEMNWQERVAARGLMDQSYHELKPETLDRGPIPHHSIMREHLYIVSRGMVAPMLQQISYWIFPNFKWPIVMAYPIYLVSFSLFLNRSLRRFERFALIYGTLDEKKIGRDRIPDASIPQLAKGFVAFLVARTFGEFYLKWDQNESPLSNFAWTTPVRMFFWLMVLDYFFYTYHRLCHEHDFLWRIHARHHNTRHPSPSLAILADNFQEVIEIALCPLAATLIVPMSFHELFLMMCYCAYVEILGHTGMRASWDFPITGPILKVIGCELQVEDHDLHHRYGKSGRNYGKQSRFWDVLFGTTTPREEMANRPGLSKY
ncbi:hypothetical protein RQP46_010598 [Phenoliferia psychrophenolica]